LIDERNFSELGANMQENQMKVKHIAYGMKPQASDTGYSFTYPFGLK
jgi:hypothetical protein